MCHIIIRENKMNFQMFENFIDEEFYSISSLSILTKDIVFVTSTAAYNLIKMTSELNFIILSLIIYIEQTTYAFRTNKK